MSHVLQERAITELVANGGTVAAAMRKAGYSPNTARTPKKLTQSKTYKKKIQPFIKQLEIERQRAIDMLKKRISKARYRDLNDAIEKLTKTHQLLTGGSTENIAVKPIYGGRSVETIPRYDSNEKAV